MPSGPLVRYILMAAIRDRLIAAVLLLVGVGAALSVFLGSSAVTEADGFALVFAAGGLRFAVGLGLVLFVVFHVRRSFDTRDIDYLLSRPVGRVSFLLSHAAAFSLIAVFMAGCVLAAVTGIAPHKAGAGHLLWGASLAAEFLILVNAALFFAMVLPAAAGALAVFGLYVLARVMGQLLGIVDAGALPGTMEGLAVLLQAISLAVPRLDLLAQTSWLVYGPGDGAVGYGTVLAQGVVYSLLTIAASLVDLVRRQF